jgi:hypothetical protein
LIIEINFQSQLRNALARGPGHLLQVEERQPLRLATSVSAPRKARGAAAGWRIGRAMPTGGRHDRDLGAEVYLRHVPQAREGASLSEAELQAE